MRSVVGTGASEPVDYQVAFANKTCTRYGYGGIRVRRIRVLPVQTHMRSSGLNLRVSTGGRNVHRGTGSTSTEVSVLLGSDVTYIFDIKYIGCMF
eukprot:SAG11_NODE_1311_length_5234_cov_4.354820_5_plen_95_part_00